ncbi:hypothetical protein L207DRAFT_632696 [Hyaloscypha variabilis F]|uniref:Mid2 domain-containing protein n=1 Tax=Hyaloscypha variabilis (strain UAMH 11265 / GT02V1 / F) TaxID=1149755 RepID=A0A2J6RRU7_HYAVF|nr:hypothetical protein L207DRAFT_632696 [Hyaloscypha variabilis F]
MSTLLLAFTALVLFSRSGANAQSSLNYAYVGGIPLRTPGGCPAGSVTGQITFQQNCCGADQTFVKDEASVCCPDSTDCYSEVVAAPKCADPSWQLCGGNDGGFCCEENWVCWSEPVVVSGVTGAGVGCSTPGATLTKGQTVVATVYAANAGPGASTTTSTSAAPSTSSSGSQATPTGSANSESQSTSTNVAPPTTESPGPPVSATSPSSSLSSDLSPTSSSSNSVPGASSQGPSSVSTPSKNSSSLGGGAIAGIATGALALLVAAFVSGIWLTRRKNKPDPSGAPMLEDFKPPPPNASDIGIIAVGGSKLQAHIPELGTKFDYTPASELPTYQQQPVEMYAPHTTT